MSQHNLKFNIRLFEEVCAKVGTVKEFCRIADLSPISMYYAKCGRGISERNAKKLSEYTGISFDEWTRDVPSITVSFESQYESEEVIIGLVGNIRKRLSTTLSQPTINEINEVINSIIVESTYLGVMAQKNGHSGFVERAMKRRLTR